MKKTFNCLNEAFNLPHSNIYCFEEDDSYTKFSNIGFNKKKKNIPNTKLQILEIINDTEVYYKKSKGKSNNTLDFIDSIINELIEQQKQYLTSISKKTKQDKIKEQIHYQKSKLTSKSIRTTECKLQTSSWTF